MRLTAVTEEAIFLKRGASLKKEANTFSCVLNVYKIFIRLKSFRTKTAEIVLISFTK